MLKIITIWLANIAIKITLVIVLMTLVAKVIANDGQTTTFSVHTVALEEIVGEKSAYVHFAPGPYKPGRNSSLANRQFAPAYRLRETPYFAVKTNVLHDLTTSMNLGVEMRLSRKWTVDVPFTLNPWTFNKEENTKFKFFLFQPELRFWECEPFNGHFFGVHGHYAYYNVSRLPTPPFSETMNQHRFEGQLAGAGVSYGYHWMISPRWSFEAEIGAGYARLWYDKFPCQTCAKALASEKKDYWGVTRAGLTFLYLF